MRKLSLIELFSIFHLSNWAFRYSDCVLEGHFRYIHVRVGSTFGFVVEVHLVIWESVLRFLDWKGKDVSIFDFGSFF